MLAPKETKTPSDYKCDEPANDLEDNLESNRVDMEKTGRRTRTAEKSVTINIDRVSAEERASALCTLFTEYREELQWLEENRPRTRGDCENIPRPCPFVSCKYNLYIDVDTATGSIKINWPDKDLDELKATCALDVADRGGMVLEGVGEIMNLTRERIRQIEVGAALKSKMEFMRMGYSLNDDNIFSPEPSFVKKSGGNGGISVKSDNGKNNGSGKITNGHQDSDAEDDGGQSGIHFPDDIIEEW